LSKRGVPPDEKLGYYLLKTVNRAVRDYQMIADGDRIAVAVSGGKDSLSLLRLLRMRQRTVRETYQLVAVSVMLQPPPLPPAGADMHSALEGYFRAEGYEHSLERVESDQRLRCFRCSHLRRRALAEAAQRLGCNKIALGHHADDAAQTTLLNLLFHGRVETLHPRRPLFDGRFTLIRPLIYLPEKAIERFALACAFPPDLSSCAQRETSRRTLVRNLIRALEKEYPKVKINLFRAGLSQQVLEARAGSADEVDAEAQE